MFTVELSVAQHQFNSVEAKYKVGQKVRLEVKLTPTSSPLGVLAGEPILKYGHGVIVKVDDWDEDARYYYVRLTDRRAKKDVEKDVEEDVEEDVKKEQEKEKEKEETSSEQEGEVENKKETEKSAEEPEKSAEEKTEEEIEEEIIYNPNIIRVSEENLYPLEESTVRCVNFVDYYAKMNMMMLTLIDGAQKKHLALIDTRNKKEILKQCQVKSSYSYDLLTPKLAIGTQAQWTFFPKITAVDLDTGKQRHIPSSVEYSTKELCRRKHMTVNTYLTVGNKYFVGYNGDYVICWSYSNSYNSEHSYDSDYAICQSYSNDINDIESERKEEEQHGKKDQQKKEHKDHKDNKDDDKLLDSFRELFAIKITHAKNDVPYPNLAKINDEEECVYISANGCLQRIELRSGLMTEIKLPTLLVPHYNEDFPSIEFKTKNGEIPIPSWNGDDDNYVDNYVDADDIDEKDKKDKKDKKVEGTKKTTEKKNKIVIEVYYNAEKINKVLKEQESKIKPHLTDLLNPDRKIGRRKIMRKIIAIVEQTLNQLAVDYPSLSLHWYNRSDLRKSLNLFPVFPLSFEAGRDRDRDGQELSFWTLYATDSTTDSTTDSEVSEVSIDRPQDRPQVRPQDLPQDLPSKQVVHATHATHTTHATRATRAMRAMRATDDVKNNKILLGKLKQRRLSFTLHGYGPTNYTYKVPADALSVYDSHTLAPVEFKRRAMSVMLGEFIEWFMLNHITNYLRKKIDDHNGGHLVVLVKYEFDGSQFRLLENKKKVEKDNKNVNSYNSNNSDSQDGQYEYKRFNPRHKDIYVSSSRITWKEAIAMDIPHPGTALKERLTDMFPFKDNIMRLSKQYSTGDQELQTLVINTSRYKLNMPLCYHPRHGLMTCWVKWLDDRFLVVYDQWYLIIVEIDVKERVNFFEKFLSLK